MKKSTPRLPPPFDPERKRYTTHPFPPYQFIPGITEHPHKILSFPPLKKGDGGDFLYGVDLYNFNYWWEAHEAWEVVWHTTEKTGDDGRFLQGLIQISAGMIKWWIGNRDGMTKLFREGTAKLASLPIKNHWGIDLGNHLKKIALFRKTLQQQDYPFIEISGQDF